MWIHGTSIQVEYTDRIGSIIRRGFHTHIECKPGLANWFHFAIPTPVIVSDGRLKIDSVMLMFKTGSADVAVKSVHVYDGPNKIASYDYDWAHALKGDHPFERFDVPGQPEVLWGIGISVQVGAGVENMAHWIEFSSAGGDFA
jgi:hypothetical protein